MIFTAKKKVNFFFQSECPKSVLHVKQLQITEIGTGKVCGRMGDLKII